ncbi:N-acetylneuraminate synthase family protein [Planctomycetota bacterium]
MQNKVKIGSKITGSGCSCYIISELGAMYEDLDGMKEMIRLSAEAGADAVKVQTYKAETMAHRDSVFEFSDGTKMSQYDFFKKYEISEDCHVEMAGYAKELGITFFSTPSDASDVDFLDSLGVPAFKTGSDDLTNYPFLEYIAEKGKPMIVSTGMSDLEEVEQAVNTVLSTGNEQLILLHCTVSYPSPAEHANLRVITALQRRFGVVAGYSNHVQGVFPNVLAAATGADVVEVHFTLDRSLKRPDYQVALDPAELKQMVDEIRLIPVLRGVEEKTVTSIEEKWRRNARKSLIASRNLNKGDVLRREDIKIMRPGTGVAPKYMEQFVNKTLKNNVRKDELLSFELI